MLLSGYCSVVDLFALQYMKGRTTDLFGYYTDTSMDLKIQATHLCLQERISVNEQLVKEFDPQQTPGGLLICLLIQ